MALQPGLDELGIVLCCAGNADQTAAREGRTRIVQALEELPLRGKEAVVLDQDLADGTAVRVIDRMIVDAPDLHGTTLGDRPARARKLLHLAVDADHHADDLRLAEILPADVDGLEAGGGGREPDPGAP